MSPTIPDKSYVFTRIEANPLWKRAKSQVLANSDTEATLKRMKDQGDLVLLVPDNKSYDPYVVTPKNPAQLFRKSDSTE